MSNWKFKAGEILTTKHWSGYRRSEATSTVIAVVRRGDPVAQDALAMLSAYEALATDKRGGPSA